jgi:hypothetical protein
MGWVEYWETRVGLATDPREGFADGLSRGLGLDRRRDGVLGRIGILESVAGNGENHLGTGLNPTERAAITLRLTETFEEGRYGCGARRFDEDALIGGQPLLGGQDL